MKRKRLEAWATAHTDGTVDVDTKYLVPGPWCEAKCRGPVRLVECGPDEVLMPKSAAAVVRAAVRWAANASELSSAELYRAVRSMQKGRK